MGESDGGAAGQPSRKRPRPNNGNLAKKRARPVVSLNDIEVVAPPENSRNSKQSPAVPVQQTQIRDSEEATSLPQNVTEPSDVGNPLSSSIARCEGTSADSSSADVLPQPHRSLEEGELEEHAEAKAVVESLDRGIIRVEEQRLMDQLDKMIVKKEEKVVMQHLLDNVHKADDLEYLKSLPPIIQELSRQIEPGVWEHQGQSNSSEWKRIQHRKRKLRKGQRLHPGTNENSTGAIGNNQTSSRHSAFKLTEVGQVEIKKVRQPIPKWRLSEASPEPQRLFSRLQFVNHVVLKLEQALPPEVFYCPEMWKVRILEEDPNDPFSYLLEAQGHPDHLEVLRQRTETFVQKHIAYSNGQALLEDDDSLFVTVSLSISNGPLGIRLAQDPPGVLPSEGVWIESFRSTSGLGQLLGGSDAYGKGCVLLSINDTVIADAAHAQQTISQAKHREKHTTRRKSHVTLCLSKYADFRCSSDSTSLSIRRIGGEPYDAESHEEFLLERYMGENPPLPSWIERMEEDDEEKLPASFPDTAPRSKKDCKEYCQRIMADDRSVEVELVMDTSEGSIGAKLYGVKGTGLFLRSISPEKQLGKALGRRACMLGAVLWKIDGEEVWTKEDYNRIIESMGHTSYSVTLGKPH
jgi:hypothetical protein